MDGSVSILYGSLLNLWSGVLGFLPNLLVGIILLVVGLIVAAGLATLVEQVFKALRLDQGLARLGVRAFFERAGMKMDSPWFLGRIVYWFVVVVFLLAVFDVWRLVAVSDFLRSVLYYIPNILVAALIVIAAVLIGGALEKLVRSAVSGAGLRASEFAGALTRWAIYLFGFFAALSQLGVAAQLINILVGGFVAMVAIAGGIAFGLGGKDFATSLLRELKRDLGWRE